MATEVAAAEAVEAWVAEAAHTAADADAINPHVHLLSPLPYYRIFGFVYKKLTNFSL